MEDVWAALLHPADLLALDGEARRHAGAVLVLLVRYQVASALGRRPSASDLAALAERVPGERVEHALLTAFRLSDPSTEVRGDAFLAAASAVLRVLQPDLDALRAPVEAALASAAADRQQRQPTDHQQDRPEG